MNDKKNIKGFTIIELLIATAVFSLVLLIFLTAFIRIGNLFYKGVNMSNTQEVARSTLDDITNDIKFSRSRPYIVKADSTGLGYFCIGQHRYKYNLGQQVGAPGTVFGLLREDIGGVNCPAPTVPGANPVEMLDGRMQLNQMDISCDLESLCTIKLHVVYYGDDNSVLVSPGHNPLGYKAPDADCTGGLSSAQLCAVADYSSTVSQKI